MTVSTPTTWPGFGRSMPMGGARLCSTAGSSTRLRPALRCPPRWVGLKFFNVYGPNEYHKGAQRSVAAQLHAQIRETGRVRLFRSENPDYPDGGQLRDFVWVGDCVRVALWALAGTGRTIRPLQCRFRNSEILSGQGENHVRGNGRCTATSSSSISRLH